MSGWSLFFFILAALYLVGALMEFPIMFDGNPKTRWMIKKMGKGQFKMLLVILGIAFIVIAVILK